MQENVIYKEMGGEKKGEKYHKPQFFNVARKRFFSLMLQIMLRLFQAQQCDV